MERSMMVGSQIACMHIYVKTRICSGVNARFSFTLLLLKRVNNLLVGKLLNGLVGLYDIGNRAAGH